jgi:hypothetical protein
MARVSSNGVEHIARDSYPSTATRNGIATLSGPSNEFPLVPKPRYAAVRVAYPPPPLPAELRVGLFRAPLGCIAPRERPHLSRNDTPSAERSS